MTEIIESLLDRVADLERRMANVVLEGKITEVKGNKAKVKLGPNETTGLLPVSGWKRIWDPIQKNDLVTVISPSGQTEKGIIFPGGLGSNGTEGIWSASFGKSKVELSKEGIKLVGKVSASEIKAKKITVSGEVVAKEVKTKTGVALGNHSHICADPGKPTAGAPQ